MSATLHTSSPRLLLILLWMMVVPPLGWGQAQDVPVEKPAPPANLPEVTAPPKPGRARSNRTHAEPRVAVGSDVAVREGEAASDVVVVGGHATIDGKVTGDLVVIMGTARLGPKAEVRHDLVVIGKLEADPAAKVGGEQFVFGNDASAMGAPFWLRWSVQWVHKGLMQGRPLPHQYGWSWAMAGLALLLYLGLAFVFPRQVQAAVGSLETRPGNALVTGLLAFLLIGPLLVLLMVTVVGLPVVPFAVAAFVVALLFGKAAVYRYTGQQLGQQFHSATLQRPCLALLLGGTIFCLLYTIPALGFLTWAAVAPFGLGAVLLALFGRNHEAGAASATVAGASANPAGGVAGAGAPMTTEQAVTLPRAGFWIRLLASLLDLTLVGMVIGALVPALSHHHKPFLFVWVAFHLAFWAWRGTTIGGMVCRLKIVRLDGRPMNAATALVRLLASFFSAAALGLGFFWAGWSRDKQSWHDRIAGTVIVKVPNSAALV